MQWHQYQKAQLAAELGVDLGRGLTPVEAGRRLAANGENRLPEPKPEGWGVLLFRQVRSPFVYVLLICTLAVLLLGNHRDAVIIAAVLAFNAAVGAAQEGRSQRALLGLRKLTQPEATVLRGGAEAVVPETSVVVGDILVLKEGQRVAADARVLSGNDLSVDESTLTGESGAVQKHSAVLEGEHVSLGSRTNVVFKGTAMLTGSGTAVVVATGAATELGKTAAAVMRPDTDVPLRRSMEGFSRAILALASAACVGIFILGVAEGRDVREMFAVAVSLAVSAIPEGLPLVVTLTLVTGVWRMAARNALVKKLQAVEALGRADVLCVDKTGTITENAMVVRRLHTGGSIHQVSGDGYRPTGSVSRAGSPSVTDADVLRAATVAGLSVKATAAFSESEGRYLVTGDPTEVALSVFAEKLGRARGSATGYREVAEAPFDHHTRLRATYYREAADGVLCAAAGAPEAILARCTHVLRGGQRHPLTGHERGEIEAAAAEFAGAGLRLVSIAERQQHAGEPLERPEQLTYVATFGIEDAIRPAAKASVADAQAAGLRVVMITGDHRRTAEAVAKQVGIFHPGDEVISGDELDELTTGRLAARLGNVSVFARVSPEHKLKIIEAYRANGKIVAMTGDGVNDAPPLVAADLGVAMGKAGTEVAREAADIVLLDDNLGSVVAAVAEGRAMFASIQRALMFLISTSLGELLTVAAAVALGMPLPLLAVQILWLNLVTDPLIGLALALSAAPEAAGTKREQPKNFLGRRHLPQLLLVPLCMAAGSLLLFSRALPLGYGAATSVALTVLAVFQWWNALACTDLESGTLFSKASRPRMPIVVALVLNFVLQLAALHLAPLRDLLGTVPLSPAQWVTIAAVSLSVLVLEEIRRRLTGLLRSHGNR